MHCQALSWKGFEYKTIGPVTHAFYAPSIQIALNSGFHKTPDLAIERLEGEMTFSGWILPPAHREGADIKPAAAIKLGKREAYGSCSNCNSQQSQPGDENGESAETVHLQKSPP